MAVIAKHGKLKLGRTFVFKKIQKIMNEARVGVAKIFWRTNVTILTIQVALQAANDRAKVSRQIDIINIIKEYVFISRL